jgi:acetyl-CoA acetyltransferase
MKRAVHVIGVGMTPFVKPGSGPDYHVMARAAGTAALADAGIAYADVEQAYAGYVYGDSASGQRALYELGLSGIPVVNVNNNCSSGSSALFLARQAIEGGLAECVLALGFEKMERGALAERWLDRESPLRRHVEAMDAVQTPSAAPMVARMFGGAAREYRERYGTRADTFAKITVKARRHAEHNPNALFREQVDVDAVLASDLVYDPLTRLQCCPPTCGAAAAVLCSADFAARHGITGSVTIAAQAMTTDTASSFTPVSMIRMIGYDLSRAAASQVYEQAGIGPSDVDVIELHDCFTVNEVLGYEALGLCGEGEAERMIVDADNTYGGRYVINPSGGLLSKGHPLGATGLAQCTELVTQLRGRAGPRQVDGVRIALQHNIGLGGACVVTLYRAG